MSTDLVSTIGWVPRDDTFSTRLAMVRHRMGWNAKEAALACGLPQQSWREWELGRSPHKQEEVARKIAQSVGCDYLWLLAGVERPTPPSTSGNITAQYCHDSRATVVPFPQRTASTHVAAAVA